VEPADDPAVQEYRRRITEQDVAIVGALNQRIELVSALFSHKREHDYPISDPGREERLLADLRAVNDGPLSDARLGELMALVLDICRAESRSRSRPAAFAIVQGEEADWEGGRMTEHHSEPNAAVEAFDITRTYGVGDTAVEALRGVSLTIPTGQFTAVMGPSGSGKSTLMHILAGLDLPTTGRVSIAGNDITKMSDTQLTQLRRDHIGFIFQFFNLLPMLTAEENILLPLRLAGENVDQTWANEIIDQVGLADRRKHRPSELSGGQQQRVAIARALASRPTVMFADEPTGNLDSHTSGEILHLLRATVTTYGQTTVMVTHDANAAAMADRVLFLADGQIVRDQGRSEASDVLAAMAEVSAL